MRDESSRTKFFTFSLVVSGLIHGLVFLPSRFTPPPQQYARTNSNNSLAMVYVDQPSGAIHEGGGAGAGKSSEKLNPKDNLRRMVLAAEFPVAALRESPVDASLTWAAAAEKSPMADYVVVARPEPGSARVAPERPSASPEEAFAGHPSRAAVGLSREAQPRGHINTAPEYPTLARRRGWEGRVVLRLLIEADGRVSDVKLEASSGRPVLDQAAWDSVSAWQYEAAVRNGVKVASWISQAVEFRINPRGR